MPWQSHIRATAGRRLLMSLATLIAAATEAWGQMPNTTRQSIGVTLGDPVAIELPMGVAAQSAPAMSVLLRDPTIEGYDKPLPINLPTALQLANARPLDVALASQRIQVSLAALDRAQVLWLPTIYLGGDYYRHDGQLQDVAGKAFGTSKSTLMYCAGPSAVFAVTDAIFSPLVERQVVRARQADLQTAMNDSLLRVAEAYFNVQQARGELAGAQDAARRAEYLVRRSGQL